MSVHDISVANCEKCCEPDSDDMVQCDQCDKWFHFMCVGVGDEVQSIDWSCEKCLVNCTSHAPTTIATTPPAPVFTTASQMATKTPHVSGITTPVINTNFTSATAQQVVRNIQAEKTAKPVPYYLPFSTPSQFRDSAWQNAVNFSSVHPNNSDKDSEIASLQKRIQDLETTINKVTTQCGPTPTQIGARQAIPRDLPPFHGDVEEWPLFISNFETSTKIGGYTNDENLMRLQHCLKGKARELVRHKLLVPSMVPDIIRTLQLYFGQPEHIIESLINRVRKMPAPKDKLENIIDYALAIQNVSATMEACHLNDHLNNPMLVREFLNKLPDQYKLNWAMTAKESGPVIKVFSSWLFQIAEAASMVATPTTTTKRGFFNTHTVENKATCRICKGNCYSIAKCQKFINLPLDKKWNAVREHKLCRHCLNTHKNKCNFIRQCRVENCEAKHHALLHKYRDNNNSNAIVNNNNIQHNLPMNVHNSLENESKPLFRIIPINIFVNERVFKVFAFLDEGASVSLIDEQLFNEIGLQGEDVPLCLRWTNDVTRKEESSKTTSLMISGAESTHKYKINNVHTVANLALPQQTFNSKQAAAKYTHLSNLPLPSYVNARPLLLIGSDNWMVAVPLKTREGKWNEPIATKTRLGWAVQGGNYSSVSNYSLHIHTCECQEELTKLHKEVQNYFKLEASEAKSILSADDSKAMQILNETCKKQNGKYETGLLWRNVNVELPDSYEMALKRAKCLQTKLNKDRKLKNTVQSQIDNLEKKNYARKLSEEEAKLHTARTWYLPIFIALNPNKPGKVLLVWDGAAKSNGVCLNDFLLSGPDLLNSLTDVLMMFRIGQIAVCGDISEMFHRINVCDEDMHAQRFLYFESGQEKPSVYVMKALSFGTTCAPCIANFIRNRNADDYAAIYPRAVEAIHKNHYMDDYIDSYDNESEACDIANKVRSIHSAAGFDMHNWSSNSANVLNTLKIAKENTAKTLNLSTTEKILGMFWDPQTDSFKYICRFVKLKRNIINEDIEPTKREILQVLMSIFDPLGFMSCYTISLKILLQDVWRSGIDWDEKLTSQLYAKWCDWKNTLNDISTIRIPRTYFTNWSASAEIQLHTFVDAGENAYAAVSYLRIQSAEAVEVSLIWAKAKVSPLKVTSIPRLELQAAVMGCKGALQIQQIERLRIAKTFWWSDSKTVLQWLRMDPKRLRPFVMFRVAEILEKSNLKQWRWVPSKQNTADIATRPAKATDIDNWLRGPQFLMMTEDQWPQQMELEPANVPEVKCQLLHITKGELQGMPIYYNYFSDWSRLCKAVANFMKYMKVLKTRMKPASIEITNDMLMTAKTFILKDAQLSEFSTEVSCLLQNKCIHKNSSLIALNVYLDDNKILRVQGRAEHLNNNDPIVLPAKHYLTFLIVRHFHEQNHHIMHETTINCIRGEYHIPKLRSLYKKVRKACQRCIIMNASPNPPQMAPIPAQRLACFERPFTFVGVDYFGPLLVNVGRRQEKRYGALFTCLTLRAVHIEIAHSLDAQSCAMALQNFMARRGTPKEIFSDNGTNFTTLEKLLRKNNAAIKWNFNPPAAPHMGGIWERLVRSVKNVLAAIAPTMIFNDESLKNSLCEVEFLLNARPLTHVSLESSDDEALTPNHLLIGSANGEKPEIHTNGDIRQRLYKAETFANHFWKRWVLEYRPILTKRAKWFQKQKPLAIGDAVIIIDEMAPRNTWKRGIITEVIVAKDGQVRRAFVKTKSGVLQRPATKLAVLQVQSNAANIE